MRKLVFSSHPLGRSLSLATRNWVNPPPTPRPKGGGDNVGSPLRGSILWSNA
jgi:hypothetical protein